MERHPLYGLSVPERGWTPAPRYVLRRSRVLALAGGLPRGRLLEVGCGAGALLDDLSRLGFSCTALETSETACALARYVHAGSPAVRIAAAPEPGWHEAFDVLVSLEVLEHIEDDAAALLLWHRWLRPGGALLLSVPARAARWSASDVWAGHYRRYEWSALGPLLTRCGFRLRHLECYGFPLSNLLEPIRALQHRRILAREAGGRTAAEAGQRRRGTARSGTERIAESRLWRLQTSWPGRLIFRAGFRLQERFLGSDRGTGYLALAERL